jgi:hypothetical protein
MANENKCKKLRHNKCHNSCHTPDPKPECCNRYNNICNIPAPCPIPYYCNARYATYGTSGVSQSDLEKLCTKTDIDVAGNPAKYKKCDFIKFGDEPVSARNTPVIEVENYLYKMESGVYLIAWSTSWLELNTPPETGTPNPKLSIASLWLVTCSTAGFPIKSCEYRCRQSTIIDVPIADGEPDSKEARTEMGGTSVVYIKGDAPYIGVLNNSQRTGGDKTVKFINPQISFIKIADMPNEHHE